MKRILLTNILLIVILFGAAAAGYYYYYQVTNYVATDDAQVQAPMVYITPKLTARLLSWQVAVGDKVTAGQVMGTEDTSSVAVSNPASRPPAGAGSVPGRGLPTAAASTPPPSNAALGNIVSPMDGTVIQSNVVPREVVVQGQPIAVVADLGKPYIIANIDETEVSHVMVGDVVDIAIDAYPGVHFTGKVDQIGLATQSAVSPLPVTNTGGNFTKEVQRVPVQITLDNAEGVPLIPGLNASVKIHR